MPGEVERERPLKCRDVVVLSSMAHLREPIEGDVGPFHVGGVVFVMVQLHDPEETLA